MDFFFAQIIAHKKDIVYCLIILNIIVWIISYRTVGEFYNNYITMPPGAGAMEVGVGSANTDSTPRPIDKEWALDQWEALGGKKLRDQANLVFFNESGFNENAFHCNNNGSVDLGFYQFNSVHIPKRLSIKCAGDIECATQKALEMYKEQGWTPWTAAKKLGF